MGINFKMSNTLFRVIFVVLCSRIGTQLTSKRPPRGGGGVGLYQYTETLRYGDGQLPRVCRCVKNKKMRKGIFSSCAARSAIIIYDL